MILIITGRTASVPLNDFLKNKSHTRQIVFKKLFQVAISRTFYNYLTIGTASCNYSMNKFRETN